MVGEVLVILAVVGDQRQVAGQAAGGDPGVVRRSRAAAELRVGLQVAPRDRDTWAVREDHKLGQETLEFGQALWSPLPDQRPLGQFADGYERDREAGPDDVVG